MVYSSHAYAYHWLEHCRWEMGLRLVEAGLMAAAALLKTLLWCGGT